MTWWKSALTAAAVMAAIGTGMAADGPAATGAARACLDQNRRNALLERGKVVKLSVAIRSVRKRYRGEVIRAQLCRGTGSYVYLLTVLTRSGKVRRASVDAATGRLIGVR